VRAARFFAPALRGRAGALVHGRRRERGACDDPCSIAAVRRAHTLRGASGLAPAVPRGEEPRTLGGARLRARRRGSIAACIAARRELLGACKAAPAGAARRPTELAGAGTLRRPQRDQAQGGVSHSVRQPRIRVLARLPHGRSAKVAARASLRRYRDRTARRLREPEQVRGGVPATLRRCPRAERSPPRVRRTGVQ
jgi:hypothetical protein